MDEALTSYEALSGFEEKDLQGTLINIKTEVRQVAEDFTNLKGMFQGIKNKQDSEEYQRFLADQEIRDVFYKKLSVFSLRMGIALSSRVFYEEYGEKQIDDYKKELKFFQSLRRAVKNRYAEMLDRAEYEPKIKRILDTYVTSGDMVQITGQVDIFDRVKSDQAVENAEGKAAMADTIAYNTRRTIHDKFDEDPVFFKKFSDLLEEAIAAFRAERMSDAQYLEKIKDIAANIINKDNKDLPRELKNNDTAAAVYRVIKHELESTGREGFEPTTAALAIDDIIIKNAIVDWQYNEDAKNTMINKIEDYLLDNVDMEFDSVDTIISEVMKIAAKRHIKK